MSEEQNHSKKPAEKCTPQNQSSSESKAQDQLAVVHLDGGKNLEAALYKFLNDRINLILMEGEAKADSGGPPCCSKGCCR